MLRTILVVDDYAPNRELIRDALDNSGYEITEAQTASEALEHLRLRETDLVTTDVRMPGISGVDLLRRVRTDHPDIVVILVSAFASVANAVEAMKLGAYHYLAKPIDIDELQLLVHTAIDCHALRIDWAARGDTPKRSPGFESIRGSSRDLFELLDQATRAARTNSTVLIQGETATGKELLALEFTR
jgi:DNA-binding NtrC family response regulator